MHERDLKSIFLPNGLVLHDMYLAVLTPASHIQTVDGALAGHCRAPSSNLPLGGGRRLRGYLARVEREGVRRVRMFVVITAAYVLFWGPLFIVTLLHHPSLTSHIAYEVSVTTRWYFSIALIITAGITVNIK